MKKPVPQISYELAPPGSPDKYVLTEDASFIWTDAPEWIWDIVAKRFYLNPKTGRIIAYMSGGRRVISACVYAGFFFAVSVAPSFKRALGAACLHDWIYSESEKIAKTWGVSTRDVLHIADHFFLALMRATGFLLARGYFCGVRMLGYGFHKLFGSSEKHADGVASDTNKESHT